MALADLTITDAAWAHCERVLRPVLALVPTMFIDDVVVRLPEHGVRTVVAAHDTAALFDWIVSLLSRQDISNHVAAMFAERNGSPTFADMITRMTEARACAATGISPVVDIDARPASARSRTISSPVRLPLHRSARGRSSRRPLAMVVHPGPSRQRFCRLD